MSRGNITLKELAKILGVSISTISKALNNSEEISEDTKVKVKELAALHNYKPNIIARNLKSGQTKTIGVIIPNMLNYYFAQVLKGIEKTANDRDYKVITCITNESHLKEVETLETLSTGAIDGFIVSVSEQTELKQEYSHFKSCIDKEIPLVMFDRVINEIECDKVIANDVTASADAVTYLHKKGAKKIAYVSVDKELSLGKLRHEGYLKGLKANNLEVDENLIIRTHEPYYKKHDVIVAPLFNQKFDAVITSNESVAIAILRTAQEKDLKIPQELSVLAFSNGILARHSNPRLSTISQHAEIMGEKATEILIDKLQNKTTTIKTEVVETDIVVRDSSK